MSERFQPRHAVRALLIDRDQQRVLLIHTLIPDTDTLIWLAPGGGIERGEDKLSALYREIKEETGHDAEHATGPIWHRRQKFQLHGVGYDQYEEFYVVPTKMFEPNGDANPAAQEKDIFRGFRWWSSREIEAAKDDIFVPLKFAQHYTQLLKSGAPKVSVDVGR